MCSNSRFDLHTPKALDHCFRVQQRHVLRLQYSGAVLTKEFSGLSKEACLYAGADWLKRVCQSEGGVRPIGKKYTNPKVKTEGSQATWKTGEADVTSQK